jgi:hypothetical protein
VLLEVKRLSKADAVKIIKGGPDHDGKYKLIDTVNDTLQVASQSFAEISSKPLCIKRR